MKKLNLSSFLLILLAFALTFSSCDKEDSKYDGKNELYFIVEGDKVITESEDTELEIKIQLTRTLEKDVTLSFKLTNKTTDDAGIIEIIENPIVIKAGEKTAILKVKSAKKELLTDNATIELDLETTTNSNIIEKESLKIIIKPSPRITPLTEAQKKLIEGYKTSKGIDLSKFIGFVPVKVKVYFPGGGGPELFTKEYERNIEGKTAITLSKEATADKIVLKMETNAMGIEAYLYEILRGETVLTDYWTNTPNGEKIMELVGLSKDSQETFEIALDNIVLNTENKTFDFLTTEKDEWGTYQYLIFDYKYSAWDRFKKLIDENNQDARDINNQGGTLEPVSFLKYSPINYDDWGEKNWVEPTSSFDAEKGEIKFVFNMDHTSAVDYIKFEVTYTSQK